MSERRAVLGYAAVLAGLSLMILCGGCQRAADPWEGVPPGMPKVLTSFPPLYCFASNVAGPDAAVHCLLTTVDRHDFSPKAHDALQVRGTDLFVVNGLGLDEFVTKIVNNSANRKVKIVEVGAVVPKDRLLEMGASAHGHSHAHGHHHAEGSADPHVWLGIPEAILMVERIRDELKALDPAHAAGYDRRAADYVKELRTVQDEGKAILAAKKNRKIIATHESLGYFARAFGLELEGSIQPRVGVDADATQLARLVKLCKDKDVRVITVEPQYSRATAETLGKQFAAKQVKVEIVEVDPMETVPDSKVAPGFYVQKMRENINNLAKHLP